MNKTEVSQRPGWTAGRIEKFLVVEKETMRRGCYGMYTEYEYSLPQVLEAEKSIAWRTAAAKYLKTDLAGLALVIAAEIAEKAAEKAQEEMRLAELRAEWAAEQQREKEEQDRIALTVRGGLRRLGCSKPLSDGWRSFEVADVLEYVDFADRRGKIDADYIDEFYRLWHEGEGYCNSKGVLRKLIASAKERIIRILLYLAKKHKWVYGRKGNVLYFDTPCGQASFHLREWQHPGLPVYTGEWTGIRNSKEVLMALASGGTEPIYSLLRRNGRSEIADAEVESRKNKKLLVMAAR